MATIRLSLDELAKLPFKELDVLKALVKLHAGQPMPKVIQDLNLDTQTAQSLAGFLVSEGGRDRLPLLFAEEVEGALDELVLEVQRGMNQVLGTQFASQDIRRAIVQWYNRGYKDVQDYVDVVRVMADAWRDEPKLKMHLRPATLFGKKFEEYRNIAMIQSMPVDRVKFDDEFTGI
jgi:uncharacterized phage protein (TIGR02220 family)